MKSFLAKNKKPLIKWGMLPDNRFFEGNVPEGFQLCICPGKYIVVDVDVSDTQNGFNNMQKSIAAELYYTLNYATKRMGRHYWLEYTGNKILANKTSGFGIDLRIGEKPGNAGGYVVYYPKDDIRKNLHLIKKTSTELNSWLEELFSYK